MDGLFLVLTTLLRLFPWVRFVFGAFLIRSDIEAARTDDDDAQEVVLRPPGEVDPARRASWGLAPAVSEEHVVDTDSFKAGLGVPAAAGTLKYPYCRTLVETSPVRSRSGSLLPGALAPVAFRAGHPSLPRVLGLARARRRHASCCRSLGSATQAAP